MLVFSFGVLRPRTFAGMALLEKKPYITKNALKAFERFYCLYQFRVQKSNVGFERNRIHHTFVTLIIKHELISSSERYRHQSA